MSDPEYTPEAYRSPDLPESLEEFLDDDERAKPVAGFRRDYWITSERRIVSMKGASPCEMSTFATNTAECVVNLCLDGERHRRSVTKIWATHWGDYKAPYHDLYTYLRWQYDDKDAVEFAEKAVKPRIGSEYDTRYDP